MERESILTRQGSGQSIKQLKKLYEEKAYKVAWLCQALIVSRSGYYKWLNRQPSQTELRLEKIMGLIQEIHETFKVIYGYLFKSHLKSRSQS